MIEYKEVLQRDPLEDGKVRVVRYRREVPMDTWLNTETGKTFQSPSRTQGVQDIRVRSIDPADADLAPLSREQARLACEGWCPPKPITLRSWTVVADLRKVDGLQVCPECGGAVSQPDMPYHDWCICESCEWEGDVSELAPKTLRCDGGSHGQTS